jgi:predicted nucleotidyltransferase component of viral defense system
MNQPPDSELIDLINRELGIDPAYIEKDWYAVQVIKAIANHSNADFECVFSGGTNLSKAYKLIERFSEDLDFRAQLKDGATLSRPTRRALRKEIVALVSAIEGIDLDESVLAVTGNSFQMPLTYPKNYEAPTSLRSELKLEFSFTPPRESTEPKKIASMSSEYTNSEPETELQCLKPIETAADKFSALTWRVLKRDRTSENDDPAMIRHLHDLHALKNIIFNNKEKFIDLVQTSFETDQKTSRRELEQSLKESAQLALGQLSNDTLYKEEYEQFVANMSYADEENTIHFDRAKDTFMELILVI